MRKTKNEKAITLIALIITIVILLILAVVTIGSIKNSNIITYAQNASSDYNKEKDIEDSVISGYESLIKSNLPDVPATTIVQAQQDSMLMKTVNSEIKDEFGNKIVIPAGFKVLVDNTTVYTKDNIDVTKGIVIQDAEGNEFVWIPVGENIKNGEKEAEIKLSRYSFKMTGEATDEGDSSIGGSYKEYEEEESSSYKNARAKNLAKFLNSANTNNGYYIARYEAGIIGYDEANIKESNTEEEENWTAYVAEEGKKLKLVSKPGQKVWDCVTQKKASELCQNMYEDNSNFTSDLINSYSWDTAIIFIQTFETEKDNAYKYSVINNSKAYTTTGSEENSDKYCNIYDMSGNAAEWSTETFNSVSFPCLSRGGYYITLMGGIASCFTSEREYTETARIGDALSFRSIIYI